MVTAPTGTVPLARYYVAPNGADTNSGSIEYPFATLNKVWSVVAAGDLVYLRGGTYALPVQQYLVGKSGTPEKLIKVWAYPGEKPVLTRGPGYTAPNPRGGTYFSGNYVHFKGIEITGFFQENTHLVTPLLAMDASHNIFESLNVHHNGGGFYLQGNSTGNLVLNSDFHHNYDPLTNGGNADGMAIGYVAAGTVNTIRGSRSWSNSDDGFDCWSNDGEVIFENNWSWSNGYVPDTLQPSGDGTGFKYGTTTVNLPTTVLRTSNNNVAFKNRNNGYDWNGAQVLMKFHGNVAYANGRRGFNLDSGITHIFKNNISYNNVEYQVCVGDNSLSTRNATGGQLGCITNWTVPVTDADFASVSPAGVDGPRQADGSLPVLNFMRPAATSRLIDAGAYVGMPYNGTAPEIGAFER